MGRIIAVYGAIGAIIVAAGMLVGMAAVPDGGGITGMVVGYLTMLVALTMVFVGVKRHRDTACGGVIKFLPAFGIGLAIAGIASLGYVVAWEAYMYATDYTFMDQYIAGTLKAMRAEGRSPAEIARFASEMAGMKASYANPVFRMLMTLSEIAPVAIVVALVSAAVLRNSRMFPAVAPRG